MSASKVIDPRIIPEKETIGEWEYDTVTCYYCKKNITTGRRHKLGIFGAYNFEGKLYDELNDEIACLECVHACTCIHPKKVGEKCLLCKEHVCGVHHYDTELCMCKGCAKALLRLVRACKEES